MGQPVVHFEIIGKDGAKLQSYYSELFGWEIDANNPMNYGIVQREGNVSENGVGIGGGIAGGPEGHDGHVTVYVGVPDVEAGLANELQTWPPADHGKLQAAIADQVADRDAGCGEA